MSQNVVFSVALHKSNVRIQKKKRNYIYSYLKIKSKKGKIDRRVSMFLIRRLKTKKLEMFLMQSGRTLQDLPHDK